MLGSFLSCTSEGEGGRTEPHACYHFTLLIPVREVTRVCRCVREGEYLLGVALRRGRVRINMPARTEAVLRYLGEICMWMEWLGGNRWLGWLSVWDASNVILCTTNTHTHTHASKHIYIHIHIHSLLIPQPLSLPPSLPSLPLPPLLFLTSPIQSHTISLHRAIQTLGKQKGYRQPCYTVRVHPTTTNVPDA